MSLSDLPWPARQALAAQLDPRALVRLVATSRGMRQGMAAKLQHLAHASNTIKDALRQSFCLHLAAMIRLVRRARRLYDRGDAAALECLQALAALARNLAVFAYQFESVVICQNHGLKLEYDDHAYHCYCFGSAEREDAFVVAEPRSPNSMAIINPDCCGGRYGPLLAEYFAHTFVACGYCSVWSWQQDAYSWWDGAS
eukprot:scaffold28.g7602.t1